jgi:hypothetical protein
MLLPLFVWIILTLAYFLTLLWDYYRTRRTSAFKDLLHNVVQKSKTLAIFVLLVLYTNIASAAITPFQCIKQPEGNYRLAGAPTLFCFDDQWNSHVGEIVFFTLVYFFFAPAFFILILVAMKSQNPTLQKYLPSTDLVKRYDYLIRSYKGKYHWWEMVHLLKRTSLVVSSGLAASYGTASAKYYIAILIMLIFLLADVLALPHRNIGLNKQSIM